jgi:hypothetical protein
MNEAEDVAVQVNTNAQSHGFYEKFTRGEFGLAKTYWVGAVASSFIAAVAMRAVSSDTVAYCIGAAFVMYQCLLLVALWNAGRRYQGSRIWPVLAFLMVLLAISRNIGPVLELGKHN